MSRADGKPRRVFRHLLPVLLSLFLGVSSAGAAQVNLSWDANAEADLAGYRVYYGNASRVYQNRLDVGMQTSCLITDLDPNSVYYFTATAYDIYGNESVYASEIVMDPNDADGDSLPNALELAGGTNPSDADSDDDGISDGIEDTDRDGVVDPGETDPRLADSDGDGLQDGTELSYTLTDALDGTDLWFFIPDLDPSTTTDPLDADSDDDGIPDGAEDADHNGRVDAGETNPNFSDLPLLFSDDFSDGGRNGDPEWMVVSGKWRVDGRKRYVSSLDANCRSVVADPALRFFPAGRIESRVQLTSEFLKSPNAAILFAMSDRTHYRWVRLTGKGVSIGQTGDYPGEIAGRKAVAAFPLKPGQWYELRVDVALDGSVKAYLGANAEPVAEYSFAQGAAGAVGLQTRGCKTRFDDFAILGESAP